MALSILHRITGGARAVGTLLRVYWVVSAAYGPAAFAAAQGFVGSILGQLLLLGWSFALFYHLCNGIRHLFWDAGKGFALKHGHASAIAAIAWDETATVVAGNVERVISRLFLVETPLPAAKPGLTALAARLTPHDDPAEWHHAVMDLGATICTARSPACAICPWSHACAARARGLQSDLPRRSPRPGKPTRHGRLWLGHRNGAVLLERRPDKGLLGGMLGIPGDGWDGQGGAAPAEADWQDIGEVRHTFTHFHLTLRVLVARIEGPALRGDLVPLNIFRPADLPSVMRKAWGLARSLPDGPAAAAEGIA
jgi:succinate dehydrogenase cytochrome b556 subunit